LHFGAKEKDKNSPAYFKEFFLSQFVFIPINFLSLLSLLSTMSTLVRSVEATVRLFTTKGTDFAKSLEPRFILFYAGCAAPLYFYLQIYNFDLRSGHYHGKDPALRFQALARQHNDTITEDYYKADRQTTWHQKYYKAMSDADFFRWGHLWGGFVWWAGMGLQLTSWLRNNYTTVHLIVGYASFIAGQFLALSGFYGLLGGGTLDLSARAYEEDLKSFKPGAFKTMLKIWLKVYVITFWLHGAWLMFTGWMYLYNILQGRTLTHRKWILFHMMVGFATLMKRVSYMAWPYVLMYSPVDLHFLPGSVVKATFANVWIYIAHALAYYLIQMKQRA
jgi:hypothetical protein